MDSKPGHRRRQSLCEGLMLEESEKGILVVSGIDNYSSANQGLKKGDEIVGATIHFDELSKDDVLKLLKLIEPFNDKVEVLTKNTLRPSKSLGTLDPCVRAPEEMLKDSYNRLYNAKIKNFMKVDTPVDAGEGSLNGELTVKPSLEGDMRSPQLSMTEDVPSSLQSPDIGSPPELIVPEVTIKCSEPEGGVEVPRLNMDASSPNLNATDHHFTGPSPEGPDLDIKPDVNPPNIETQLADLKIPGSEQPQGIINIPNVSLTEAGLEVPVLDSNGPEVNVLDIGLNPLEGNILVPTLDINAPKLDIEEISPKKCEMPKFKMPDLGLSGPNMSKPECEGTHAPGVDHTIPKLDLNAPDINMKTPSGKVRVRSAKKLKSPSLNVDDPSSYVELPKVRLSGRVPKGQGLDIDTGFKIPDVDLRAPMIDASHLSSPNTDLPSVDLTGPKAEKLPNADIADLDLSGLKIDLPDCSLPNVEDHKLDHSAQDIDMPSDKLEIPSFKKPQTDLQTPVVDVGGSTGKFKMPNLGFSGTLPKKHDLDLDADVKRPDLSLKAPKIKGGVDIPDMTLPKVDLKAPKLDINTPHVDLNAPSAKLKIPKFKMPTFGLSRPQGPEVGINGNLEGPNLSPKVNSEMSDPKLDISPVDLKCPGIDVDGPSGKFKLPCFKMPDFGLSRPKATGPDIELKTPDLDLSAHKLKRELSPPDLSMPDVDLQGPKLDLNSPDIKIGMPSGKLNTLNPDAKPNVSHIEAGAPRDKFKMPKLFGTLSKRPDVNVGLTTPDLSLKTPNIKGGIDGPDLDLPNMNIKTPKLDVNTLNVDNGSPKGKFKMPKLRLPHFDLSGLKGPNFDIDGDLDRPNINLGVPKPVLDIDAPSLDLKSPKTDLKIPDVGSPSNVDLPSGKVKTPTLNLKEPKMDVNAPGLDIDAPSGKFKMPKFKMPKFSLSGLKGPDIDIGGDIEGPDVDINAPQVNVKVPKSDLKIPDVDLGSPLGLSGTPPKGPHLDINAGAKNKDLSLKAPKIKGGLDVSNLNLPNITNSKLDGNTPNLDIGSPKTKLKMPKLKIPTFGISGPKGTDGDLEGPGFNIPQADVSSPSGKFKMPSFKMPDFGLSGPKMTVPDINLPAPKVKGGNLPDMDLPNVHLKDPQLDLTETDVNLNMPSKTDLKTPKPDMNSPDIGIDLPSGKFKMPTLKMPKFGLSGLNGQDSELNGGTEGLGNEVNVPSSNFKGPQTDLDLPEKKCKLPSFKMPQFGSPDKRTESDISFDTAMRPPDMNISPPKAKFDVKAPNRRRTVAGTKLSPPDINTSLPKPAIGNTELHARASELDIDAPSGKYRVPHSKHTSDISGPNMKIPVLDIDADVEWTHTDGKSRKVKGRSSYPVVDAALPKADPTGFGMDLRAPDLNIDDLSAKVHIPKPKKSNLDRSQGEMADINSDSSLKISAPKLPPPKNYEQGIVVSQTDDPNLRSPEDPVFPKQLKTDVNRQTNVTDRKVLNRRSHTLGRLDLSTSNVDLEVPEKKDLKGSTFWFSKLI